MKSCLVAWIVVLSLGLMPKPTFLMAEEIASTAAPSGLRVGPNRVVRRVDPSLLVEGWQLSVDVPRTRRSEAAVCQLSVESGWICAKRESEDGLEWQVVLARAGATTQLEIAVVENHPAIDISYNNGRFFIKDTAHALRIVRERKDDDAPLFAPVDCLSTSEPRGRSYFKLDSLTEENGEQNHLAPGETVGTTLSGWDADEWFFIASGPSDERIDCLVRLNPIERAKSGYGFQSVHAGLTYAFHGEAWALDDGQLFVAFRMLPDDHRRQQQVERIRDNLPGSSPPAIDAAKWLNTDEELSWSELMGKVVLVDFWGTWCGPCVKKLPEVQALASNCAERGLVVIGVHTAQGAETCEPFVKQHGIRFPIALDTGQTQKAFAVTSVPAYFLVDTEGKVVFGYSANPPSTDLIEALLPN